MSQAWLVTSGKGGVGKSMIVAALSVALSRRQLQTVALDTDIGLRNLDMMLGLENKVVFDVVDVAHKQCKLKYALIPDPLHPSLSLLPAAQIGTSVDLDDAMMSRVVKKLKKRFAYVMMDAPAGVERGLRNAIPPSDHSLLITTADDVAMRDAERVIALLSDSGKPRPLLIVNRVRPEMIRRGEMYNPQVVANTLDVPLLGYIPEDSSVLRSVNRHQSFMDTSCPAQAAIERICRRFLGEYVPMPNPGKKRLFSR